MSTYLALKEKKIGLVLLLLTAIAYTYVWFGPVFQNSAIRGSNPILYYLVGLGLIALAALGVLKARRMIAGALCMIVAFGPWGKYIVFPFPVLAFGAFTAFKRSPQELAKRKEDVQKRRESKNTSSKASKTPSVDSTGRSIPVASKRYTPPVRAKAPRSRRSS